MLEKVFENKIKKLLKEKQAYYVKFFGCGITTAGTPDILTCVVCQWSLYWNRV